MQLPGLITYLVVTLVAGFFVLGAGELTLGADSDDPLVAEGKLVFEETAGGIGCAACHGLQATGNPDTGAPYIIGVSRAQLGAALHGGVPDMDFFKLSRQEAKAVLAYLQSLKNVQEEPVDPEEDAQNGIVEETEADVDCKSTTPAL